MLSAQVGNFTFGFAQNWGVFEDEPYYGGAGYVDGQPAKGHLDGFNGVRLHNGSFNYLREDVSVENGNFQLLRASGPSTASQLSTKTQTDQDLQSPRSFLANARILLCIARLSRALSTGEIQPWLFCGVTCGTLRSPRTQNSGVYNFAARSLTVHIAQMTLLLVFQA